MNKYMIIRILNILIMIDINRTHLQADDVHVIAVGHPIVQVANALHTHAASGSVHGYSCTH